MSTSYHTSSIEKRTTTQVILSPLPLTKAFTQQLPCSHLLFRDDVPKPVARNDDHLLVDIKIDSNVWPEMPISKWTRMRKYTVQSPPLPEKNASRPPASSIACLSSTRLGVWSRVAAPTHYRSRVSTLETKDGHQSSSSSGRRPIVYLGIFRRKFRVCEIACIDDGGSGVGHKLVMPNQCIEGVLLYILASMETSMAIKNSTKASTIWPQLSPPWSHTSLPCGLSCHWSLHPITEHSFSAEPATIIRGFHIFHEWTLLFIEALLPIFNIGEGASQIWSS